VTRVNAPLVSVIVPVFDMARFLPDAIESIEAQGQPDVEIIVVDDGSRDDTPEVVAALGDRVVAVRQQNRGPAAARNHGIDIARGKLIAFLDADDLWPVGKLARQLEHLTREPDLDVVLGRIQYVALDGGTIPDLKFEDADAKVLSHVHLGSGLFRRRAFARIGTFDENFRISEDIDWFLRAREAQLRMIILRDVTLVYRLHDSNMTRDLTVRGSGMVTLLKRSLDRRRAAGITGELLAWHTFDEPAIESSDK
jgi:glycosyltransferase involved in cell wall biosynthesis